MKHRWGNHSIYKIYTRANFGPMRADIFRYCKLYDTGGFYFDISKGLSRPIDEVYGGVSDFFLCLEGNTLESDELDMSKLGLPQKLFLPWGMGFSARHELLANMIDRVVDDYSKYKNRVFSEPKKAILEFTGPIAFSRSAYAYFDRHPHLTRHLLGVDFDGTGIYSMRGSGYRHLAFPSYANSGPGVIVS